MSFRTRLASGVCAVFAGLLVAAGIGAAAATKASPLVVAAVNRECAVMQGDPIVVRYSLTNVSNGVLYVRLPRSAKEAASAILLDERGAIVPTEAEPGVPVAPRGSEQFPAQVFCSGNSFTQSLVLGQIVRCPKPGAYRMLVSLRFPCAAVDTDGNPTGEASAPCVATCEINLTVRPADPVRLAAKARELGDMVRDGGVTAATFLATDALLSMPPTGARPAWAALVANPQTRMPILKHVVDELPYYDATAAAHLLCTLATDRGRPWIRDYAASRLWSMYRGLNGDSKAYVAAKVLAMDGNLPK